MIFQGLQFIFIFSKEIGEVRGGLGPRSEDCEQLPATSCRLPAFSGSLLPCRVPPNPGTWAVASLLLVRAEEDGKKPQRDLRAFKESISKPHVVFSARKEVVVFFKFV